MPALSIRLRPLLVLLASIACFLAPLAAAPEKTTSTSSQLQVLDDSRQEATTPVQAGLPADDIEALRAQVEAADRAFNRAARERDQAAFRAWLAQDTIFFAGELHQGRLEVLAIWQHLFAGKYDFRYEAETLETNLAHSGEFGWSIGRVRTSFTRPGLTTEEATEGHYMNLWRPGEGDTWSLAYSSPVVVHAVWGEARDPRSGLMTAWPELADQIDAQIELRWHPEKTVRAASGEVAYSFGRYEASFARQPEAVAATGTEADPATGTARIAGKGHFLAIWQKDEKGHWQLVAEGLTPPGIYGN